MSQWHHLRVELDISIEDEELAAMVLEEATVSVGTEDLGSELGDAIASGEVVIVGVRKARAFGAHGEGV